MEAEHDDLQAVAAVGALEEARPDEVIRAAGREVDAAIGQAVAVRGKRGSIRTRLAQPTGAGAKHGAHARWPCYTGWAALGAPQGPWEQGHPSFLSSTHPNAWCMAHPGVEIPEAAKGLNRG